MRAVILLATLCGAAGAAEAPYQYFIEGNPADVQTRTSAGLLLAGGGQDQDAAFRWLIRQSGGGDIVVVRASGAGAYNRYIYDLGKVDSVETLVVKTPAAARDPFVVERIRRAEALFIAGGDQWNYMRVWKGTPMVDAMQSLVDRGVPVGGTSAGLAVLPQFVFTAEKDTVTSAQALADPYDERVTVGTELVRIPLLRGIVTDTHFAARDRMGRTLVFLARMLVDGQAAPARAIAADERTAALVEADGSVAVEGEGSVYFLRAAGKPEICRRGAPLTMRGIEVYRVRRGGAFGLRDWSGRGGTAYRLDVEAGAVRSTGAGGSPY